MISLSSKKQANYVEGRNQSFNVELEILENTQGELELFMIFCRDNREFFSHIASPVDVVEYGVDKLIDIEGYYRTKKVVLVLRTEADADEVIRLARVDLDEFDRSIKNGQTFLPEEVVRINA